MADTRVRDLTPMQEGNRRRWDRAKADKAIAQLVALGWQRSITVDGLTLTEPAQAAAVKTTTDA